MPSSSGTLSRARERRMDTATVRSIASRTRPRSRQVTVSKARWSGPSCPPAHFLGQHGGRRCFRLLSHGSAPSRLGVIGKSSRGLSIIPSASGNCHNWGERHSPGMPTAGGDGADTRCRERPPRSTPGAGGTRVASFCAAAAGQPCGCAARPSDGGTPALVPAGHRGGGVGNRRDAGGCEPETSSRKLVRARFPFASEAPATLPPFAVSAGYSNDSAPPGVLDDRILRRQP